MTPTSSTQMAGALAEQVPSRVIPLPFVADPISLGSDRRPHKMRRRRPEARHVLVHTGQHYDPMLSQIFLDELGVPAPDYELGVGSASHAVQTARVMERIEPVVERESPDLVVVPGDVNSTLAAALVAVKLGIPLAHLERRTQAR